MALSDYRLCDVCGAKAFYDSNLNYEEVESGSPEAYREAGLDQPPFFTKRLGYVGDWAVICTDCAKTHRCVIVPANYS